MNITLRAAVAHLHGQFEDLQSNPGGHISDGAFRDLIKALYGHRDHELLSRANTLQHEIDRLKAQLEAPRPFEAPPWATHVECVATVFAGDAEVRKALADAGLRIRYTSVTYTSPAGGGFLSCHHIWNGVLCSLCGDVCDHTFADDEGVSYCQMCGVAECATVAPKVPES